jgi:hypothetical protein
VSYIQDCYACLKGNHDRHDPDWGTIPGVIGGAQCACTGDCAGRARRVPAPFDPRSHAYRPDCGCGSCAGMRAVFNRKATP